MYLSLIFSDQAVSVHRVQRHAHSLPHHRYPHPSPEGSRFAGTNLCLVITFAIGIETVENAMEKMAKTANASIYETSIEMAKTKAALATLTILQEAIKSGRRKVVLHSSRACSTMITTAQNISVALNKQEYRGINLLKITDLVKLMNMTAIEDCAEDETTQLKEVASKAIENANSVILAQENVLVKLASVYATVTGSTGSQGLSFIEENEPSARFEIDDQENYSKNKTSTGANRKSRKTGLLNSPNYPNKYPNNLNENYPIVAPAGHTIQLTFIDFRLQVNLI